MTRQRVLFLCRHNSARSQMAEGLLRACVGFRVGGCHAGVRVAFENRLLARYATDCEGSVKESDRSSPKACGVGVS